MARTGGQLLVECLEGQGIDTVFGVPGESYLAVLDALHDSAVRFILCRQEGGAAFMAEAWGKLTGTPGICFVTRGPGATNASIGVHTAMQDSTPMILFIGQVARDMRGREAFQEVDYRAMFGPLAKWAAEIDDPARIPEIIGRAFATALSGRPGPVVIALPEDMLVETTEAAPLARPVQPVWPGVDAHSVARTADALAAAERPLVMVGGGGWDIAGRRPGRDGVAAFVAAAEAAAIPVTATFRRQDLVDSRSPAWIGDAGLGKTPGVRRAIAEADLILAVNIRFSENTTDGYRNLTVPVAGQRLIHVNPSEAELGKIYQAEDHIQTAPDAFLAALAGRGLFDQAGRADWAEGLRRDYEASLDLPDQAGPVDMRRVMAHLRDTLGPDAIITNGAGNFAIWPGKQFPFRSGQRWLAPQAGAMGAGLPAGIAAKLARPGAPVVCFAGDGDLQMTLQELGTGMQHSANPVVLLLNNGCYGTIRMHQEREYPGRPSGTAILNPDFPAIARAYGMWATRIEDAEVFPEAFAAALDAEGGALIEIPIDPEQITPSRRLSEMRG